MITQKLPAAKVPIYHTSPTIRRAAAPALKAPLVLGAPIE